MKLYVLLSKEKANTSFFFLINAAVHLDQQKHLLAVLRKKEIDTDPTLDH